MPETKHRTEPASITCSGGVALVGQWVLPFTDGSSIARAIALHPATGVDMNLYQKFAIYPAEHGWPALIYDSHGTGESATGDAKHNRTIRMGDWILYDVPVATAALEERFPNAERVAIGHSVGAHGTLTTQTEKPVDAIAIIASRAGITRTARTTAERAEVWTIFNVVSPACSRLLGHVPIGSLGIGKIIPVGVMTQWSTWTGKSGYSFADPGSSLAEHFKQATGPLLSVVFTDDLWTNRPAVDVLTDQAMQYDVIKRDIEAGGDTKNGPVGHMGFYRPKNRALWPEVTAWVEVAQPLQASTPGL